MSDSDELEALEATHEWNREQRLQAIKRWVRFIREHRAEEWGEQQNKLVNSQLESARESDHDLTHYRRIEDAKRDS